MTNILTLLADNTAFFFWFRTEVESIKSNSDYPAHLIAATLIHKLIAESGPGEYPQLWDALEATGHTSYTSETFLEAAKLIMQ